MYHVFLQWTLETMDPDDLCRLTREVYEAAYIGDIQSLTSQLQGRPQEEMKQVVEATTDGETPLIRACLNGHMKAVRYLVEVALADVGTSGTVDGIDSSLETDGVFIPVHE